MACSFHIFKKFICILSAEGSYNFSHILILDTHFIGISFLELNEIVPLVINLTYSPVSINIVLINLINMCNRVYFIKICSSVLNADVATRSLHSHKRWLFCHKQLPNIPIWNSWYRFHFAHAIVKHKCVFTKCEMSPVCLGGLSSCQLPMANGKLTRHNRAIIRVWLNTGRRTKGVSIKIGNNSPDYPRLTSIL